MLDNEKKNSGDCRRWCPPPTWPEEILAVSRTSERCDCEHNGVIRAKSGTEIGLVTLSKPLHHPRLDTDDADEVPSTLLLHPPAPPCSTLVSICIWRLHFFSCGRPLCVCFQYFPRLVSLDPHQALQTVRKRSLPKFISSTVNCQDSKR